MSGLISNTGQQSIPATTLNQYSFSGTTYDPTTQLFGPSFQISFDADPSTSFTATNFQFSVNGQRMGGALGYFEYTPSTDGNYNGWLSMGNDGAQWRGEVGHDGNSIWSEDEEGMLITYNQTFYPVIADVTGQFTVMNDPAVSVSAPAGWLALVLWVVVAIAAMMYSGPGGTHGDP